MLNIHQSFDSSIVQLSVWDIVIRRRIGPEQRKSLAYRQVEASIAEVGIIEALIVFSAGGGKYLLLDGHVRLEILMKKEVERVDCIISRDDEAYTYNRRVNSIPPVAQQLMLLKALKSGLSEERISRALQIDITAIRRKKHMLDGVCQEAIDLLQTRKVSATSFSLLKRMKPLRQVEAAEHMIASCTYSVPFLRALLFATKADDLVKRSATAMNYGVPQAARQRFVDESDSLLQDLRGLERDLGKEMLTLAVFEGYINRMLGNSKVGSYLKRRHPEIVAALRIPAAI